LTALAFKLNGRALYGTIGTKHAAVTLLRLQQILAVLTFIKILACIGRHFFLL
jgi:hypothetical protein